MRGMQRRIDDLEREKNREVKELERKIRELERKAQEREGNERKKERSDISRKRKRSEGEEVEQQKEREETRWNVIMRVRKEEWASWMERGGTVEDTVQQILYDQLECKPVVWEAKVLGRGERMVTLIVRMKDEEEKKKVMEARKRAGRNASIFVDEDKTYAERMKEKAEREKRRMETDEEKEKGV